MIPNQNVQQVDPPIFNENPIKLMLNNYYSGTLNIKNLNGINSLYQHMRQHKILTDNNSRLNSLNNINNNLEYNKENQNHNIIHNNNINNNNHNMKNNMNNNNNSNYNMNQNNNLTQMAKQKSLLFNYTKGDRIFNIIKDTNHPRRKIVKIIYEDTENYNNEDSNFNQKEDINNNYNTGYIANLDENEIKPENVESAENMENLIENNSHYENNNGINNENENENYDGEDNFFSNCYKAYMD